MTTHTFFKLKTARGTRVYYYMHKTSRGCRITVLFGRPVTFFMHSTIRDIIYLMTNPNEYVLKKKSIRNLIVS